MSSQLCQDAPGNAAEGISRIRKPTFNILWDLYCHYWCKNAESLFYTLYLIPKIDPGHMNHDISTTEPSEKLTTVQEMGSYYFFLQSSKTTSWTAELLQQEILSSPAVFKQVKFSVSLSLHSLAEVPLSLFESPKHFLEALWGCPKVMSHHISSYIWVLAAVTTTAAVPLYPASTSLLSQDSLMPSRPGGPLYWAWRCGSSLVSRLGVLGCCHWKQAHCSLQPLLQSGV